MDNYNYCKEKPECTVKEVLLEVESKPNLLRLCRPMCGRSLTFRTSGGGAAREIK
jgi:hypothetical protein